ncbi:ABC transporter permease [Mesorhizobium sp.]|jgi:spermidine/putrescine transport system permease protein|uniref:ABC transporter permease n=1 Tax=Mesorhizobium sp. TaxID=1871066 RepID=UPI000FEAA2E8|nr:ABC transporter permease [Mesorhizobium sp.]RWB74561.1 MAG: ABC transporter permease [Mesorhizobium sp.]RWE79591.1 MAG: ABC transporter permease [Mesorhizobium sp.]
MKRSYSHYLMVGYVALFIGFLLLPLLIVGGAAFNDTRFPSVWPWKASTLHWFTQMAENRQLLVAVWNTLMLAVGVTLLSVPIGTAAAIVLNNTKGKSRALLYALMTAPILTPAAVVGISTLIFWRGVNVPAGIFMTTLGVSSIISAFVMLLVLARLQSFDRALEDAALDLGATNWQVLTMVMLPHLRPAIAVGAMIAFLQALEAFNVPLFARGNAETVTIYIASQVRIGVTPQINALAVIMILIAVAGGVTYEIGRRREHKRRLKLEGLAQAAEQAEERGELIY